MASYIAEVQLEDEDFKRVYQFEAHSREHAVELAEKKLPLRQRLLKHSTFITRGPDRG